MDGSLPPSMFGRELQEQIADDKTPVPGIVTKCIDAVEAVGMLFSDTFEAMLTRCRDGL